MKRFLIALNIVIWSIVAVEANASTMNQCVAKGRAYEQEAGVTVRPAVEVRCQRTLTAFDSFTPYCIDLRKRDQVRRENANNPSRLLLLEEIWADADKKYSKCST